MHDTLRMRFSERVAGYRHPLLDDEYRGQQRPALLGEL